MVVTSQGNHTAPAAPPSGAAGTGATTASSAPRTRGPLKVRGNTGGRRTRRVTATRSAAARRRDLPVALLLILPAVVGFAVFYAYPTLRGIYLGFTEFHVLTPPRWVGLANFREMAGDGVFWHSLLVTLWFVALSVVFGTLISLVTAVVLHRVTDSSLLRGVMLLPFLISNVIAALVWQWMLDPHLGVVNIVLDHLIGHPVLFLGSGPGRSPRSPRSASGSGWATTPC